MPAAVVLLGVGTVVQVLGYVTYLQGLLRDPFYVLLALACGYGMVAAYCVVRLRRPEKTQTLIITPTWPGSARPKRLRTKWPTIAALAAATLMFTAFSSHVVSTDTRHPQAPRESDAITYFRERRSAFSLVDLYNVNWTGGGAAALIGHRQLPLAYIVSPSDPDGVSLFTGTSCALSFEIVPRERVPWVRVDSIVVVVDSYERLPQYEPALPAPFQRAYVYYVEMDNPALSRTSIFGASAVFHQGRKEPFEVLRLERGKPENMVVRINARTPGIYRFSTYLKVSYRDEHETIPIAVSRTFLFDGQYRP